MVCPRYILWPVASMASVVSVRLLSGLWAKGKHLQANIRLFLSLVIDSCTLPQLKF